MLRVLFVNHGHPALLRGGTEHFAHDLFGAIRDQGWAQAMFLGCVTALHRAPRPGGGLQTVGRGGDEVLLWIGGFDRWQMTQPQPGSSLAAFRELLQSFRPDIVHFHHLLLLGVEAIVLVRRVLPQARIVVSLHDYFAICANDGLLRTVADGTPCLGGSIHACHACFPHQDSSRFALQRLHLHNVFGEVERFVAPSCFLAERYVSWGLRRSLIQVIANGLPELPSPPEQSHARPRTRFAYFGNIAPHKGVLSLLKALTTVTTRLPDVRLELHGAINCIGLDLIGQSSDLGVRLRASDRSVTAVAGTGAVELAMGFLCRPSPSPERRVGSRSGSGHPAPPWPPKPSAA